MPSRERQYKGDEKMLNKSLKTVLYFFGGLVLLSLFAIATQTKITDTTSTFNDIQASSVTTTASSNLAGATVTGLLNMNSNNIVNAHNINSTAFYQNGYKLTRPYDEVVCRNNDTGCDIVCSDSDCSDEIQTAIDDVASKGGGTVYLKGGVYPISRTINISGNISLIGSGFSTIIQQIAGANIGNGAGGSMISIQGSNSKIENVEIDFNGDAQTYSGNPASTWFHAINVGESGYPADNTLIEKIKIINAFSRAKDSATTTTGIDLFNAPNTKINNIWINNSDSGIVITKETASTKTNYILNNIHLSNMQNVADALYIETGNFVINNLYIENSKTIYAEYMNGTINNVVINNPLDSLVFGAVGTVTGNLNNFRIYGAGITISNADKLKLNNPFITNSGSHSISVTSGDIIINKPLIYNSGVFGINLEGSTVKAKIYGGKIEDGNQYGLVVQSGANAKVYDLSIFNCSKASIGTYSGVYVNTADNIFSNLDISGSNFAYAIREDTGANNNIITNEKTTLPNNYVGTNYFESVNGDTKYINGNLDMSSHNISTVTEVTLANGGTITSNSTCVIITSPDGTGKLNVCNT